MAMLSSIFMSDGFMPALSANPQVAISDSNHSYLAKYVRFCVWHDIH